MADIKLAYGSSASFTLTAASLASDSNLLIGRQSTIITNTSNLYTDYLVAGKITTGSSPTGGEIQIYAFAAMDDTPTYPDTFGGSDASVTISNSNIRNSLLIPIAAIAVSTTSNITYPFSVVSIRDVFGNIPKRWGLWLVHNTGAALNSTGSNHALYYTPVYMTSI